MNTLARRIYCWAGTHRDDLAGLSLLAVIGAALLWPHILGFGTFLGDSDRLNTYLNMRKFEVESIQRLGHVPAWNSFMFMGFGTYGLHYIFASADPLAYLEALFPLRELFRVSGYVSASLLILAAWSAYWYIKDVTRHTWASVTGAGLYVSSAYSLIGILEVDWNFYSLIVMPLGLLVIRRITRGALARCFIGLTALLISLFLWGYFQSAAYIIVLFATYAIYRGFVSKSWRAIGLLAGSGIVAAVVAIPRVLTVLQDTAVLDRSDSFQTTCPCEVLRWLYDGIFGRYSTEAAALGNGINLHEGFQVYTSTFAALLVVLGILHVRSRTQALAAGLLLVFLAVVTITLVPRGTAVHLVVIGALVIVLFNWAGTQIGGALRLPGRSSDSEPDVAFYSIFVAFVVAVVLIVPARRLFYYAFLKLDFTHSRISMTAMLPLCALAALYIRDLLPAASPQQSTKRTTMLIGGSAVAAAGLVWAVTLLAESPVTPAIGLTGPVPLPPWTHFSPQGIMMVVWSLAGFLVLFVAAWIARYARVIRKPDLLALLPAHSSAALSWRRQAPAYCLMFAMLLQAFAYANLELNGAQNWTYPAPFREQDFFYAPPNALRPPSQEAEHAIGTRLETDDYRTEFLSDPSNFGVRAQTAEGGHEAHLSQFWRLRVVGGYVPGVAKRLAALPWPDGVRTLRSISFRDQDSIPWPLLAVLNVKYVLTVSPEFYYDLALDGSEATPNHLQIEQNPLPVTPRQFFAAATVPISLPVPGAPPPSDKAIGLNATALSAGVVRLTWQNPDPKISYRVQLADSNLALFSDVVTMAPGTTSFDLATLLPDTDYAFRLVACRDKTCSGAAADVTARTAGWNVLAPVDVQAKPSAQQVTLTWKDQTPPPAGPGLTAEQLGERLQIGAAAVRSVMARTGKIAGELTLADFSNGLTYRIEERAGSDQPYKEIGSTEPGVRSYVVTGLNPLARYGFRLRACLNEACSPHSAEVALATLADLTAVSLKGIVPMDPTRESFVEGLGAGQYATDGAIQAEYEDDRIDLTVSPSSVPRFLVLNEMYHPAWRAYAGSTELTIYPTNVVMRGVIVPPGADQVRFEFVPFLATLPAKLIMLAGLALGAAGWWLIRRLEKRAD